MSYLSDGTLLELGPDLLFPFRPENVQPCSVDLTLLRAETSRKSILGAFIIAPQEFCLATTVEKVRLPSHIGARVEGKSSWGRKGLFIHVTAGWIDPGFEGQITLELFNASRENLYFFPNEALICQLSFFYLDKPALKPYQGKYQNQEGVTPAR